MGRANASLNDVAAHAGVSAMTVSRVVNGSGPVSAQTRAKVVQSLQELGVRRDRYASIAAGKRGRRAGLGLVVVDARAEERRDGADFAFYARIAMAAMARLGALGCRTALTDLSRGVEGHLDALVDADAVIACSPLPAAALGQAIAINRGLLVVGICQSLAGASSIAPDDAGGAVLAAERAAASGHRRVAVLTASSSPGYARRARAFTERLRALRPGTEVAIIDHPLPAGGAGADDAAVEAAIAARWDGGGAPPDLVFAVGGYATLMLHRFAQRRRLRIPDDLGIIGFDAMPFYAFLEPAIDRIEFSVEELGRLAVDELVRRHGAGGAAGPVTVGVPCTYVAGGSLRPATA